MPKRDKVEMAKRIALKRIRAAARLEASIVVDRLLNVVEDEFLDEFDRRVASRQPYELAAFDPWIVERVKQLMPPSAK